jgi:hypothetical protein
MATKTLTIRLPANLYQYVNDTAGEIGMPISTYVRSCIEKEHEISALDKMRCELLNRLDELRCSLSFSAVNDNQPNEILYLVRELAADRNPQIIQKVQALLNHPQVHSGDSH